MNTPIFHFHLEPLPRRKGRNLVQISAYVSGMKLRNWKTGALCGRRSTESVITHGLIGTRLPLEEYFNRAERAERRWDAMVGRHIVVALPRGLSTTHMLQMLERLAQSINSTVQSPVLFALHLDAAGPDVNPHGHLVFGGRPWDEASATFARCRFRELDKPVSGGKIIEQFRETWEGIINSSLPPDIPQVSRLSHKSLKNGRAPRRHLGYRAVYMEKLGLRTSEGDFNALIDEIDACDKALASLEAEENRLLMELEALAALAPLSSATSRLVGTEAVEPDPLAPLAASRSRKHAERATTIPVRPGETAKASSKTTAMSSGPSAITDLTVTETELQEVLLPFRRTLPREAISLREIHQPRIAQ